jgi:hypothetical protein
MSDPTTTTTYTPAESAAARTEEAQVTNELRESTTPEGHEFRTSRHAKLERLRLVAYAEAPPTPATGPSLASQLAAGEEIRRLQGMQARLPVGDPLGPAIIARVLELTPTAAHGRLAASQPEPFEMAPQALRGEPWLDELVSTSQTVGLGNAVWPLLHLVAGELATGHMHKTDDEARAEILASHGEERGEEIIANAVAAANHLPREFRAWLGQRGLLANVSLVVALGRAWGRARAPKE